MLRHACEELAQASFGLEAVAFGCTDQRVEIAAPVDAGIGPAQSQLLALRGDRLKPTET